MRISLRLKKIASFTRSRFQYPTILLRIHYFVHQEPSSIAQIETNDIIKSRFQSLPYPPQPNPHQFGTFLATREP
jgi:hypothetical protein